MGNQEVKTSTQIFKDLVAEIDERNEEIRKLQALAQGSIENGHKLEKELDELKKKLKAKTEEFTESCKMIDALKRYGAEDQKTIEELKAVCDELRKDMEGVVEENRKLVKNSFDLYNTSIVEHKEPELVYCMQTLEGGWKKFDEPADQRELKLLPSVVNKEGKLYDMIQTQEYTDNEPDGTKGIWLGHWNDGPKEI